MKNALRTLVAMAPVLAGLLIGGILLPSEALAACTTSGTVTTCTGTTNLGTTPIGTGNAAANDNRTVNVASGATVTAGNANAISLRDNVIITVGDNATVTSSGATGGTNGLWSAGKNTIEFRSNGTLTVGVGATVSAIGTANNAEAVNLIGSGNTVINHGTISAINTAAIWFEDQVIGAANTIDNYGIVRRGSGSDQTVTDNSIGSQRGGDVNFINRTGAIVYGGLSFAGGNDTLTLFPSSVVTGGFDGGGGTNTLTLAGDPGTSDSLAGNISNFQTLTKTGGGTWTLTGTVGSNSGAELAVEVQQGTLVLTGNNTDFNGSVVVDPAGILEARAQSLPPAITDNGLVRFAQPDNGTYSGVISGTGAVTKTQAGVLTLSGVNTYQGGTTIQGGTIAVNADNRLGAASGSLTLDGGTLQLTSSFNLSSGRAISVTANDGTINTNSGVTSTVAQGITGAGTLTKAGAGTLILTGNNTYADGTVISGGGLQIGNGGTTGSITGNVANNGTLTFNRSDSYTFGGTISGTGSVSQTGSGVTILSGNNSYTGSTTISSGWLYIDGDQSAATGPTTVASGARLGGDGVVGGDVTIGNGGTLSPGVVPLTAATLTINGDLNLNPTSNLFYNLVEANVAGGALNDLDVVAGDLVLDGVINIVDQGQHLGPGVYRIIDYSGTLTNNGLTIGSFMTAPSTPQETPVVTGPLTGFTVQTSIAGQVNLVNTGGLALNYWDVVPKNNDTINGGTGTWQASAGTVNDNWTGSDGAINAPWSDGAFAIFTATAGTVTVDDSLGAVEASGMQFMTDGYVVTGDAVTLVGTDGTSTIRVGDGTTAGAGVTATINSVLGGAVELDKTDLGTLILNGTNTYTGGTTINGGVLQISADNNLGASASNLTIANGSELRTTATFASNRAVILGNNGGVFDTAAGTTLTLTGPISESSTGALLAKAGDGTLVVAGTGSYTGGTLIDGGTVQVGNGGTTGSILGNVANAGTLAFNRSDTYTFAGTIAGGGSVSQIGSGTTILTGNSSYRGGTTISDGTLQLGNGGTTGSINGNVANDGALVFNRSNTFTFSGTISGTGSVSQTGSGVTILSGNNSYTGATTISNGWLYIDGDQSAATGPTTAASGTRLAGDGIIGGDVTIANDATLSPGVAPLTAATLTINGDLNLNPTSILFYNMLEANVAGGALNDLDVVNGDLVLDGVINIVDQGQDLGPGVYRIIDYSGTLTNNGLTIGSFMTAPATPQETPVVTRPLTGFSVQTAIPGQVNLINTSGLELNYWDGDVGPKNDDVINGGNGIWRDAGPEATFNWTDAAGNVNAPWADEQFAIFTATPGTVTVSLDSGPVLTSGMQFAVDGYVVTGDEITLVPDPDRGGVTTIRVGDGTSAGAAMTATIEANLVDGAALVKDDLGTLILEGTNTYAGGTLIDGGTLEISRDANLGASGTGLAILNGSTLRTTATFSSDRMILLANTTTTGTSGGTIETAAGTELTVSGAITEAAGNPAILTKAGAGVLVLTSDGNTYSGGTTISAGTLQLGAGGTTGGIIGNVANSGALVFERSNTYEFDGVVSGTGTVEQAGSGTTILTADSTYTGGTTISDGVLQLGNGGPSGSIVGDVADEGTLAFDRSGTYTFEGTVSGTGTLEQIGSGTTILTADNTYSGGTTISDGTLQLGEGGTSGSIVGDVVDDGTLVFNRSDVYTFDGTISGTGSLSQIGSGTTVLTADDTYTGGTTISDGTLQLGSGGTTGSIVGDISNNGILAVDRSNEVTLAGRIIGNGALIQQGPGTTILTGNSTYSGGTTISDGTLQLGNGSNSGSIVGDILDNGTLAIDRSDLLPIVGDISGSGNVVQQGAGETVLLGTNSYDGTTDILSGSLYVNGDQSAATGLTTAASGGTLGGIGTIGGDVVIADGATLVPGDVGTAPGTLTINGGLTLNGGSTLNYNFGQAGVVGGPFNDLTSVEGDLVLDGTLNVVTTEGGAFDPGVYRVISYAGSFTNNGLEIGTIPSPDFFVQTTVANQVNLVNTTGLTFNYWDGEAGPKDDGVINGGDGFWQNFTGNDNWTDEFGVPNAPFADSAFAIFMAEPGTVTVDDDLGIVRASGMQFASDGYVVEGDAIELVAPSTLPDGAIIRVGDGSSLGAGYTATINSVLNGDTALIKTDLGTLVLTAANTYTGGTAVNGGVLEISADNNLGASGTDLGIDDGTLRTTANITSTRDAVLGTDGGIFETASNTTFTLNGAVSGDGSLTKAGGGALVLTGDNSYGGATNVLAGTLYVDGDQTAATGLMTVATGATLSGTGVIGGDVDIANGATLSPGDSPGTLTINGDLTLNSGSLLAYEFGEANVPGGALNDLTVVGGDLVLDGTLNVTTTAGGEFGPGVYRVFNYAGTLTDNGLIVGTIPSTDFFVQTSVANQVNLVNLAGLTLNYWDGNAGPKDNGVVNGGNGIWQNSSGNDNWTTEIGIPNAPFTDAAFAIFMATPGTVTVDDSLGPINVAGMQFASGGYLVQGDPINLVGGAASEAIVRVGDGTAAGAGMTATIASVLQGDAALTKTDLGTLVLSGANTYGGGTIVNGGVLQISADNNLGASGTALSLDGGTLRTTANVTSARPTTLGTGDGTFETASGTTFTQNGVVSGGGSLTKTGTGTTVLTAANTYTGGTTISAGTLQLGSGGTTGSITGNVANNGTLAFDRSNTYTFGGVISGNGAVSQVGSGTTVLTAANTYTGGTTISAGTLQLGSGGTTGSITGNVANNGMLVFNRSNTYTFDGTVSGTGSLRQIGSGTTILTADNGYTGPTSVNAGSLYINGDQSAATGTTTVGAATLGGTGTIGGDVTVAAGTLAPGGNTTAPGALTINGDLSLAGNSSLAYSFGEADVPGGPFNDLTDVGGDLTLDGTLNVTLSPGGSFTPGIYRVFNYGGALTDNRLELGTMPPGTFFVQTSVANQVNLVNATGLVLSFWDGAAGPKNDGVVNGGDGTWLAAGPSTNDNWTNQDGSPNAPWQSEAFAIFMGTPGTVTIDNSSGQVVASGMQFASDGYLLQGDPLLLVGTAADPDASVIRVGDGTAGGADYTATIGAVITGDTTLTKTDLGTLVLSGANTYTGGTAIDGGVLQISADNNLGAAGTALSVDGGTLRTTANITSARATTLEAGGGTFETAAGTTFTLSGVVDGAGALTKTGTGITVLTAENTYSGGTTISAGTLQLGNGGTTGSITGNITNNAALVANRSNTLTLAGVISGTGRVDQVGTGTSALTGTNTYTGGTTIAAGTLQLGNGGATGSIVGNVTNNGTLAFDRSNGYVFNGLISGTGAVNQIGGGVTVLTADNSYAGPTRITDGALYINGDQSAGTGLTTAATGGVLGGMGTIGGDVAVNNGAVLAPGPAGAAAGTLTINGDLSLGAASALAYSFGQAGVVGGPLNDLTAVGGDLVLDGTLNVVTTAGASFDPGIYRVISYAGSMTNNGLAIGTIPSPGYFVQTSVDHQVNLINTSGLTLNYWDGSVPAEKNNDAIDGGDGIWQSSAGNDNWTDPNGSVNAPFTDAAFAVFMAAPGTVTVDNSLGDVMVSGMQFASDGYVIQGDAIGLVASSLLPDGAVIRVGDGTSGGAGYTATINSVLNGDTALIKTDLGTLVLGGANTYTGGTAINGGVVQISADNNLGASGTGLSFAGGTLRTTANIRSSRPTTLGTGGGTFETLPDTTFIQDGLIGGSGSFTKAGTGTMVTTAANIYTGDTTVAEGTFRAGAASTFSPNSEFMVGPAGRLDLDGFDQTIEGLTNGGVVRLGGAPGTDLTVAGDYVGEDGTILFNTYLGDDSSISDRMLIDGGRASGNSVILVTNIGGGGARTTGDGILLIDAVNGGTTAAGAFTLGAPAVAGPYEYSLYRGGVFGGSPDDWFLRTDLDCSLPSFADVCEEGGGEGPVPPVAPPHYRPETSLYTAIPSLALDYGNALLDSLDERMGGWRSFRQGGAQPNGPDRLAWGRIIGLTGSRDGGDLGIYGDKGPSYDYDIFAIQTGLDLYRAEHENGSFDNAGIYFAYGNTSADVDHFDGTNAGTDRLNGLTLGGYWTHFGATGWYLDAVVQGTWYDISASGSLSDMDTDAFGFGASLEGGYPIQLDNGFVLEPQAQLTYQTIDIDDGRDTAAQIRFNDVESLVGRLGMRLSRAWDLEPETDTNAPRQAVAWVRASLLNEFLGQPVTEFSSEDGYVPFQADKKGAGFKLDLGFDAAVRENVSVYGSFEYQHQFGGGDDHAFGGEVGLKAKF